MSMVDDALSGLAKGAVAGSVVPGIGTAIGAGAGTLLGVALNLAPGAIHWLGGSADVAAKAAAAVQSVTGQTDPTAAQAAVDSDPALAGNLRTQLAQIAADARAAELADTQDARATTVQLAQASSTIAWGAPVVSVLAVLAFTGAIVVVLMRAVPDGSQALANVLLGSLAAAFGQVVNYWLGSSAGSASKDSRLANMVPASLIPRPAAIVPASDVKG